MASLSKKEILNLYPNFPKRKLMEWCNDVMTDTYIKKELAKGKSLFEIERKCLNIPKAVKSRKVLLPQEVQKLFEIIGKPEKL